MDAADRAERAVLGLAEANSFIVFIKKIEGEPINFFPVVMETPTPGVNRLQTLSYCVLDDLIYYVPFHDLQRLIADWYFDYSRNHEREKWHLTPNDIYDILDAITPDNQGG